MVWYSTSEAIWNVFANKSDWWKSIGGGDMDSFVSGMLFHWDKGLEIQVKLSRAMQKLKISRYLLCCSWSRPKTSTKAHSHVMFRWSAQRNTTYTDYRSSFEYSQNAEWTPSDAPRRFSSIATTEKVWLVWLNANETAELRENMLSWRLL